MVRLAKTPFGFFAVAIGDQLAEFRELPRDPRKAAEMLVGDEFDSWKKELREKGYDIEGENYDPMKACSLLGISRKEYLEFARLVGIEEAKIKLKSVVKKDSVVIQSIAALDDLNRAINIMLNRMREWYGIHYPEFRDENNERYLKHILSGERGESMGIDLDEKDIDAMKNLAEMILGMYSARDRLEKYIEALMEEVAPNIRMLAGANLGARLIERAGGLKQLAELPASTIQVLGAEKALFKHLQKGSPPPKHGVIFQHPVINGAPKDRRGKLARSLAAKLALAARVDYYSGRKNESLLTDWQSRMKEIMEGEKK